MEVIAPLCPDCGHYMLYEVYYEPRMGKYVMKHLCTRCGRTVIAEEV